MDETRKRLVLVRLLYVSRVLCQGQGLYLQVLEGERGVINPLYNRIAQDRRHQDVQLLGRPARTTSARQTGC